MSDFTVPLQISSELLCTGHIVWFRIFELRVLTKCDAEVDSQSLILLLAASLEIYIDK